MKIHFKKDTSYCHSHDPADPFQTCKDICFLSAGNSLDTSEIQFTNGTFAIRLKNKPDEPEWGLFSLDDFFVIEN